MGRDACPRVRRQPEEDRCRGPRRGRPARELPRVHRARSRRSVDRRAGAVRADARSQHDAHRRRRSPFLRHHPRECAACYRAYLPQAAQRMHPYAAPLESVRLAGLPPTLVVTAQNDVLHVEAEKYAGCLISSGVLTQVIRYPTSRTPRSRRTKPPSRKPCASSSAASRRASRTVPNNQNQSTFTGDPHGHPTHLPFPNRDSGDRDARRRRPPERSAQCA